MAENYSGEVEATEANADASKSSRRSRSTENRNFESREAGERSPIVWNRGSRFNVPESVLKSDDDHAYSYICYSSGNEEQTENYWDAVDRHYKPVPPAEHPALSRDSGLSPFGNRDRDEGNNFIRKGGQILMKRKKEYHEAENAHYDAENHRQQYMAEMYKQVDPRSPKPFMDDRSTPRIRG